MSSPKENETSSLPAVRPEVTSALAAIDGFRAGVDGAETPEALQDVRANLAVFRALCVAALRDPGADPEAVADAKRECDEVSLEAVLKLGAMVPVDPLNGRPAKEPTAAVGFGTVTDVSRRSGVAESTLRRYRDMAAAFKARTDDFLSIARDAIRAGRELPVSKLIELVKPKPEKSKADDPPPAKAKPVTPAATPATPPAMEGGTTDPKEMTGLLFKPSPGEQKRRDDAQKRVADARVEFEREEEFKTIAPDLTSIAKLLSDAKAVYEAMAAHPIPAERMHGRDHPHPRDRRLQVLTKFFAEDVPNALCAAQDASSLDAEAIATLRAKSAKDRKRRSG